MPQDTSSGGPPRRASRQSASDTVTGLFRSRDAVEQAVELLAQNSVPADEVGVYVADADGNAGRRISVDEQSGTFEGALIGAAVGALLGGFVVLLTLLDVFGPGRVDPFGVTSVLGAFGTIGASAAAGVPIGAVIAMGRWQGRKRIRLREIRGEGVLVIVESRDMADTARAVLQQAGAERVSG